MKLLVGLLAIASLACAPSYSRAQSFAFGKRLQQFFELGSRFRRAQNHLVARAVVDFGQTAAARPLMQKLQKLSPRGPRIRYARALFAFKEKRLNDARAELKRLAEIIPGHPPGPPSRSRLPTTSFSVQILCSTRPFSRD